MLLGFLNVEYKMVCASHIYITLSHRNKAIEYLCMILILFSLNSIQKTMNNSKSNKDKENRKIKQTSLILKYH